MNKIILIAISIYLVLAVAIGYVIYLGVGAVQEHGLKGITESIWYGPENDDE